MKKEEASATESKDTNHNDGEMTSEEFKDWSEKIAQAMVDSLNKHAGEHANDK